MQTFYSLLTILLLGVALTACDAPRENPNSTHYASAVAGSQDHNAYEVRGRIVEISSDGRSLLVDHETIFGYMPAMTMPFTARDATELMGLAEGDAITFTYHVSGDEMWITDVKRLSGDEVSASPTADAEPEYDEPAEGSLYWLDGTWTDQHGEHVRLAAFEGKPVVMSMIFTNCGYACPMIVRDMKRIGGQLPQDGAEDVRYVLVSLDPDRDTPEMMQRFAQAHRLDPDQWTLLRGSKNQVRMLAATLGIRYRQESDGQFAHSNLVTILDSAGEIAHQQRGLESDGSTSAEVITQLLAAN